MLALAVGCRKAAPPSPPPEVLAQWHFAGSETVDATTNGGALKGILALPESKALLEQTLGKLSRAPYARLKSGISTSTNDCAELLRPLFEDLTRAESFFELGATTNRPNEWTLAVRLSPARAEAWRTNLATTLRLWTGLSPSNTAPGGLAGWRLQKHEAPDRIGLTVARGWVVFGAGQGGLPLQDELAARIQAQGRPVAATTNDWLQATVDWPRLTGVPRWLAALRLPKCELIVTPAGQNLRSQVEMIFPRPLAWKPEPWQFPTNLIREKVVSFTAMQGFAGRLKELLAALGMQVEPIPNQACLWALEGIPFQTFAAVPVPDSTNFMDQLSAQLPPLFNTNTNTAGGTLGSWQALTNDHAIVWVGVPFFQGFMAPASEETNSSFIFAGLFQNTPVQVPPPPELYYQVLGRTNLAYYDWEIGGERLHAWQNMTQLGRLLAGKPQLSGESLASKWIQVVTTNIGNVGTALTISAPDRMMLVRTSPHGFTGFETALLAGWLEAVNFPWGYELPDLESVPAPAAAPAPKP